MRPDSAEIQFYLRCSFVIYLLFFTYLAFVLRRVVKAAQERLQDGTAWEHLCISVIFPRIFVSSAFLFAIPIGAFHLTFGWYSSSTLSENLVGSSYRLPVLWSDFRFHRLALGFHAGRLYPPKSFTQGLRSASDSFRLASLRVHGNAALIS